MDTLPYWPPGTAAVLCAAGPHPIPVSTAIRAGDRRVLLALGGRRATLERLRDDPAVALCVLAEGAAFTAHGTASVAREGLDVVSSIVVIAIDVERIDDHLADGRTEMLGSAEWRWRDEKAAASDPAIRAELQRLATG